MKSLAALLVLLAAVPLAAQPSCPDSLRIHDIGNLKLIDDNGNVDVLPEPRSSLPRCDRWIRRCPAWATR